MRPANLNARSAAVVNPMPKPFLFALSGVSFLARLRPACAHFARCWRHLRGTSSRRTLEIGLAAMMLTQVFRLLQALHRIPSFMPNIPGLDGLHSPSAMHPITSRLVIAGDTFYASLWPSPWVWVWLLSAGVLLTILGLQQTVAAVNVARTGGNTSLLAETGEDDPRFLSSVHEEWLLADVRLRRLGISVGMAFFAELSWFLLLQAGFSAGPFVILTILCSWADNRLWDVSKRLRALIEARHNSEAKAIASVVLGMSARPI